MIPFEHRQTVEVFYEIFSNDPYDPRLSSVLPAEFKLDPLLQSKKQYFVEDIKPDPNPPFILAGAEFNTLR
jgi:hypothetical protein